MLTVTGILASETAGVTLRLVTSQGRVPYTITKTKYEYYNYNLVIIHFCYHFYIIITTVIIIMIMKIIVVVVVKDTELIRSKYMYILFPKLFSPVSHRT